ncbi:hypothetical protein KU735_23925, partial [Salmonella enterica subsp. enterica serovar Give]|nr:hypothetical protein [Salmonella enterica subsp. enterica serovar Give]
EGFGELIGFCSAWGYWLCAVIANVSYLVIVFSALSFFTDTPAPSIELKTSAVSALSPSFFSIGIQL